MHTRISSKLGCLFLSIIGCIGLPFVAKSAISVDGTRDAEYGPAVSVQTVQTGFGDNLSELDGAYAKYQGNALYLMLTGNLENNFNKLNIFIDSKPGGQNIISGANNPANDGWAGKYNGFTFDAGFAADYMFILRNGFSQFDLDYAQVGGPVNAFDSFGNVFGGTREGAATTGPGANSGFAFGIAFNNHNTAGVSAGNAAADQAAAQDVATGLELMIPLAALGNISPGAFIRICAMINGGNHDYLSNQFLGGLPAPSGNLGGDGLGNFNGSVGLINLNNFAGDQFFVVPEPSTVVLAGLGLGLLLFFRRRRAC